MQGPGSRLDGTGLFSLPLQGSGEGFGFRGLGFWGAGFRGFGV